MSQSCPTTKARSLATERMRRHRERRRNAMECYTIELRPTEIQALVRKGLLQSQTCRDRNAVLMALYEFLDQTLDEPA